jgi:hypothetical protein
MTVLYTPPTPRKPMTKARRVRIFLSRNGQCCLCHTQIKAHAEEWFIEHPEALNLGGPDDDAALWPAHTRCKPAKDAVDAGKIEQRNSAIDKNCADAPKRAKGRPFPKHNDPWGRAWRSRSAP